MADYVIITFVSRLTLAGESKNVADDPTKAELIVDRIRQEIVARVFTPGGRVPTLTRLEDRFGVCRDTAQRALTTLAEEGLVHPRGRQGTFVADHPPHLCHYGLIYTHPDRPTEPWTRAQKVIYKEAKRLLGRPPHRLSVLQGLEEHGAVRERAPLIDDIIKHRVAGLIFTAPPDGFVDTPLVADDGVPRVVYGRDPLPGMHVIAFRTEQFVARAATYLAERGRRRVAVLSSAGLYSEPEERAGLQAELDAHGLATHPYWIQAAALHYPQWSRSLVHLLMTPGAHGRPDGLLILDDNFIPHAAQGLVDAGVRVPDDVEVVSLANFPCDEPCPVPMKLFGPDIRRYVRLAKQIIDRRRHGEEADAVTPLEPISDDEFAERLAHQSGSADSTGRMHAAGDHR
jgi:DNA-binding LacI/PurR family transcriptional regulator